MADATDPLGPMWWLNRLYKALSDRQPMLNWYDAYYRGDHPLPWLAPQARDEFRRILRMTRSNYMGLVVDAMVERLNVEGFRLAAGDGKPDQETWDIWQANNLDSDSDQAWLEAGIGGMAYMLVAPNKSDPKKPHMWVEHASQAIVEHVPGTNRRQRAAGAKVWLDDWTGDLCATVFVGRMEVAGPDLIYKYEAKLPAEGTSEPPKWTERVVSGEDWPAKHDLGVPLVELPNNPRLLTGGVSEIADVTDAQDRVNKTLADRLITQDYGAFPQKWAVAWPEADEAGNPLPPIDVGRNRMVTTDVKETKFGQWEAAALDPYSAAKREDVKDIASRTRTPAQYLLGEMSNVNGETLKASESGLVSKCKQRQKPHENGLEDAVRLARQAAGLATTGYERLETIWRNPEFRTEGELTDSVVKKLASGLSSLRQSREDAGYSQEQIARMEQDDKDVAGPLLERVMRDATAATVTKRGPLIGA